TKNESLYKEENEYIESPVLTRGIPVNQNADDRLNILLDRVAQSMGATSRHDMARLKKWEPICMKVISGKLDENQFILIVEHEYSENLKYATPDRCLELAQLDRRNAKPEPVAAEYCDACRHSDGWIHD